METELTNMATERSTTSKRCAKVICFGILLLISCVSIAAVVGMPLVYINILQPTITTTVDEGVLLINGSAGLGQFISSSAPFYSQYYMFNLTNPQQVMKNKAKPLFKQIGPFVYKENRTKVDLFWEDDDNVLEYSQLINYTYDEALSGGLDPTTVKITNINVPLIGVLSQLESLESSLTNSVEKFVVKELFKAIDEAISVSSDGLFVTRTSHDLLWGYQDGLLHTLMTVQNDLNKLLPKNKEIHAITTDLFGFGNLSSVEAPNRVHTGKDNVTKVGQFIQWNNNYNISGWGNKYAAMINGTGGFLFHPGLSREENLTAFINELYRSGYFSYQEDIDVYGVELYKYGLPGDELLNTTQDPGFYANGPSGVLNLTAVFPAPLFVSKPHFLDADTSYLTNISGLVPNRTIHDSFLAAEPITGAVLHAAKRIQINLRLSRYSNLPQLSELADVTMIPIYWVAQTGTITPDLAKEFRGVVYAAMNEVEGVTWGITLLAGMILVVCIVCLVSVMISCVKKPKALTRPSINDNSETSPLLYNINV